MSDISKAQNEFQKLQHAVREGVFLQSRGDFDGAEKIYRSILESIPIQHDACLLYTSDAADE